MVKVLLCGRFYFISGNFTFCRENHAPTTFYFVEKMPAGSRGGSQWFSPGKRWGTTGTFLCLNLGANGGLHQVKSRFGGKQPRYRLGESITPACGPPLFRRGFTRKGMEFLPPCSAPYVVSQEPSFWGLSFSLLFHIEQLINGFYILRKKRAE